MISVVSGKLPLNGLAAAAVLVLIAIAPRPAAADTASSLAPPAQAPLLGVNVDLMAASPDELSRSVTRLAEAGIDAVRQPVRWAELEPAKGRIEWGDLDRVMDAYSAAGIATVLTLRSSPAWARNDPTPAPYLYLCDEPSATDASRASDAPPTDPTDLAAFAASVAERYGDRLWAVEVWSEPNLLPTWRRTGPDPEDYADLLVETAAAVHAAEPGVLVVSGALAPTTDVGVCYLSDTVFLDRLARTGALDHVDAVGIAPFGLREGPDHSGTETLGFGRAEALHDSLMKHDVKVPVWALAWGWSGLPDGWSGVASPWGNHGADVSADMLSRGYVRARCDWPWMGPMFVWHDHPQAPPQDPVWGFSLVDAAGEETPRWRAVESAAQGSAAEECRRRGDALAQAAAGDYERRLPAWAWLLAVPILLIGLLVVRAFASRLRGLVSRTQSAGAPFLTATFAALVLICAFLPGIAALLALPLLVFLAAAAPSAAIAAVAVAAPFNHAVHLHVWTVPIWPVELLVAIAVAGRLLDWFVRPGSLLASTNSVAEALRHRVTILDVLVLALVAWAGLSPLWAEHAAPAIREWRTVIVEPAILYALIRAAPNRHRAGINAVDGLVAGAVLASVWALVGVALHAAGSTEAAVSAQGVIRALGPYGSPNNLALFLGRMVPVIGAFVVWGERPRRKLYALSAIPIGAALLATFSRGAFVIGVPATVLYIALIGLVLAHGTNWRRVVLASLATVVGVVVLLIPFANTERVRATFSLTPGSTGYLRLRLWQSAVDMGKDHPLLGVGLDNFLYLFRDRYVARDAAQERFLSHPHNLVLDWWTRLGLPGILLYAGLVVGNLRVGARTIVRLPHHRALAVGVLGMQVYAFAHGLVDNVYFLVDLAVVWLIAQATLLNLDEEQGE